MRKDTYATTNQKISDQRILSETEQFYEDKFTKRTLILNMYALLITEFQNTLSKN